MDKGGFFDVSDPEKHEVRRWKEDQREGTIVAGRHGHGDQLDQRHDPTYLFVDDEQSIYVSDCYHHRVMKWRKGANGGVIVAGENGHGNSLNQLSNPHGVVFDRWGQIYIVDQWNHRVMRWREGEKEGVIIVGGNGNGKGEGLHQLSRPNSLSFDDKGNLYVADRGSYRIQKFDLI